MEDGQPEAGGGGGYGESAVVGGKGELGRAALWYEPGGHRRHKGAERELLRARNCR